MIVVHRLEELATAPVGVAAVWVLEAESRLRETGIDSDVPAPLVVRTSLSSRVCRALLELADRRWTPHIALRAGIALDSVVMTALRDGPSAALPILRQLPRSACLEFAEILPAAAICGDRRISVVNFATACHLPLRTLQWRLARAGLPSAHRMLGWMLALHSAWRLDVLAWPLKRAAHAAGFGSPEGLGNYIARHVGARPTVLRDSCGFEGLLAVFIATFARNVSVLRIPAMDPVAVAHRYSEHRL